jgi:hypothetical protein
MGDKMKDILKRLNPDKAWAKKVDKMTPSQVAAISSRLKAQGKIRGETK